MKQISAIVLEKKLKMWKINEDDNDDNDYNDGHSMVAIVTFIKCD